MRQNESANEPFPRYQTFSQVMNRSADGRSVSLRPSAPSTLVMTTSKAVQLLIDLSSPEAGVLRLRCSSPSSGKRFSSPSLIPIEDHAVELQAHDEAILIQAEGLTASWANDAASLSLTGLTCSILPTYERSDLSGSTIGDDRYREGWTIHVAVPPLSGIYGGGESAQAVNLYGRQRNCTNTNGHGAVSADISYINVPFFWSDAGWGLFACTGGPLLADLGHSDANVATFRQYDSSLDLFLFTGSPRDLIQKYLNLTGYPAPMPEWALGVWTSRASYFSAQEVESVLDEYEAHGCPVDVVNVDAWQTGNLFAEQSCNWEIDRQLWPIGWTDSVRKRNAHVCAWINPYVRPDSRAGGEVVEKKLGLTLPNGAPAWTDEPPNRFVIDFTSAETVAWWLRTVSGLVNELGVSALKVDFGEAIPFDGLCADGRAGWQVRNEYSFRYQSATHRALREAVGIDPVALFSRSGTAGSQRFPCHWVGDTPSTWSGLTSALRACLSLSLSGFAFVGSDVGGFWTPEGIRNAEAAFRDTDSSHFTADVDPELFVRWVQFGAFSPIMRFHGVGIREPFAFPSPFKEAAILACRYRRILKADLVTAAREAVREGWPIMRPMVLCYPTERGGRHADLQYLLGENILVAPVLNPGGEVTLWVPPGNWVGIDRTPDLNGPDWTSVQLQLDQIPAWRKAI